MGNSKYALFLRTKEKGIRKAAWRRKKWIISGVSIAIIALVAGIIISSQPDYVVAPEVQTILDAQKGLDFGILIPTYMPRGFDRASVQLSVDNASGPSGQPMVDLTYRNLNKAAALFLRQWVPGNPALETLNKSKPIETKWGKGWLMTQGGDEGIGTIWVDIGQLRVSVTSSNLEVVSPEQMLQMADTLGLASEDQVYTFKMDPGVEIHGVTPPPPFEVQLNSEGVQELNLTITPGGYTPIRFAVKKGIPVKINFRAIGDVGCGNFVVIPQGNGDSLGLSVSKDILIDSGEFTPQVAGDFQFNCAHNTFRGIMTVRE